FTDWDVRYCGLGNSIIHGYISRYNSIICYDRCTNLSWWRFNVWTVTIIERFEKCIPIIQKREISIKEAVGKLICNYASFAVTMDIRNLNANVCSHFNIMV